MRNLIRNNRRMWYATYGNEVPEVDENGDMTGDMVPGYSKPVEFHANLSATRGTQGFTGTGASTDYFGSGIVYSLIISTAEMTLPIEEDTLIWTQEPRYLDNEETIVDPQSAQYVVNAVARGLYHMKYAIKKLAE